ncbi:MAG: translation elongation factor Ts [Lachnospiraceae bacterium]|nr:translation elongation factor Ts [Lachnospiraceae bacterium]
MAKITAAMVKQLREMSGAGMMDCKKALTQTDGDMDKAIEFLRENGQMKAQKKADRIAAEGLAEGIVTEDGKTAAVVEVNSETDFAAQTDKFKNFVHQVAEQALASDAADLDAFKAETWKADPSMTVQDAEINATAVISENIKIRRFAKISEDSGFITAYTHAGGKIVVLVDVVTDVINDEIKEMAHNVALQAAALNPKYCTKDEVDQDYLAKEKEILLAEAKNEKPDANDKIINGMVMGRLNKELSEITLMDQVYVKAEDGKQKVSKYIDQVAKANNAKVTIKRFIRFQTGEGIEKKQENFAEEVAKQALGK